MHIFQCDWLHLLTKLVLHTFKTSSIYFWRDDCKNNNPSCPKTLHYYPQKVRKSHIVKFLLRFTKLAQSVKRTRWNRTKWGIPVLNLAYPTVWLDTICICFLFFKHVDEYRVLLRIEQFSSSSSFFSIPQLWNILLKLSLLIIHLVI